MPKILDIADAVVSELNSNTFSQTFTAIRKYIPEYQTPDYATIKVTVIANDDTSEILTRAGVQDDIAIDIGVQKKLVNPPVGKFDVDPAEVDPLLNFLEELKEFFLGHALAAIPNAGCIKAKYVPIYAPGQMREDRIFTGVVTLTFRVLP